MKRISRSGGLPARKRIRVVALVAAAALVAVGVALAASSRATVQPGNSSPPTISGNATVGSTLTANQGTWTGSTPLNFQYQWLICDGTGANCHPISGATAQTYPVQSGDPGNTARVQVIASNSDGSSTATSDPTAKIAASTQPASSSLPTISGDATVASTLMANPGSWSGATPISYQYRWLICDGTGANCHPITGATAQTYQLQSGDPGNTARVQVTASNSAGSSTATSDATAKIGAASAPPTPSTGCPSGTGTIAIADLSPPARLTIDQQTVTPGVVTPSAKTIQTHFRVTACGGRPVQGALVYATAVPFNQYSIPPEATTATDGTVTLTMNQLNGFPAARQQQLLVTFVRARKPGENITGGVSTRLLVSFPVSLKK